MEQSLDSSVTMTVGRSAWKVIFGIIVFCKNETKTKWMPLYGLFVVRLHINLFPVCTVYNKSLLTTEIRFTDFRNFHLQFNNGGNYGIIVKTSFTITELAPCQQSQKSVLGFAGLFRLWSASYPVLALYFLPIVNN